MLNIEKSEKELPKVEFPTLTISAINKHGIPTKQIENIILFIDDNSIIINNKEENNNYDKQELIELINKNISMLEKIKLEQTPEFIYSHTLIDNTSKQFCLKYMNYYFNLSYHTGTFSDKLIEEFINQIINIVLNHKKADINIQSNNKVKLDDDIIVEISNNKLKEYNIISSTYFNFSITFPEKFGDLEKRSEVSFKIGKFITITLGKCATEEELDNRANIWLENSTKTNNQNILKELSREYYLKNNEIRVLEKEAEKDNIIRKYKFIYLNEALVVFGYSTKLENMDSILNNAIMSIKIASDIIRKERNPFEKVTNKNVLYCPICNERLTYLMPDGKTLYCNKCQKYFKNNGDSVGGETSTPYTRNDVLY